MSTEKNIATLKFNQLSQAKYDTITPVEGEFYITGDNDLVHTTGNETISGAKTFSSAISSSLATSTYLQGNQGRAIINSTSNAGSFTMLAKMNSTSGYFMQGVYNNNYYVYYTAKTTVDAGTNSVTKSLMLLNSDGNSTFPGTITAPLQGASNSTSSTSLANIGWVNDPTKSTNVVHRSGNEPINGIKTFNNSAIFSTSPEVPSPASSDSSAKAVSSEWVNNWKDANTSNAIVVVESYVSGSNWYRVWSDGWIEQGGMYNTNNDSYQTFTVQLIKPMLNINYYVSIQGVRSANGNAYVPIVYNKTSSGFSVGNCLCANPGASWYACGQGA